MKLNIVPARTGTQWMREGVRTFFKQPLAMAGLFFMFMASLSVAAFVPLVGGLLALVLVPALTAGLMAAAREAEAGRFPMPMTLFIAFRQGPQATRAMLMLGALYAVAVLLVMGASALIDGGRFAQLAALDHGVGDVAAAAQHPGPEVQGLAVAGGGQILDRQAAQRRLDPQALAHGPGAQGRQQTAEREARLGRGADRAVRELAGKVGGQGPIVLGRQAEGGVDSLID